MKPKSRDDDTGQVSRLVSWLLARIRYEAFFRELRATVPYRLYVRYNGETVTVWREKD
jgi:hypothetical protein